MHYKKKYTIDQLKNKILFYIKYRFRTKKEILDKLRKLHASNDEILCITQELENLGLINDEKFINFFIKEYIEIKKLGLIRIKLELKKIGFNSQLIEVALSEYFIDEDYFPEKEAINFLNQKYNFRTQLPEDHKIIAQLGRKGYTYSTANKALELYKKNRKI